MKEFLGGSQFWVNSLADNLAQENQMENTTTAVFIEITISNNDKDVQGDLLTCVRPVPEKSSMSLHLKSLKKHLFITYVTATYKFLCL